ncbi:MAG: hypothetical protein IK115_03575 [Lachnospiraceae bacterium]|nr:hypothetical protein [Lachnospiraceae bacterium]
MRIDDRLTKQNLELLKKRRRQQQLEEDEETLSYAPSYRSKPINKQKGAFEKENFGGINTAESVFDRTAVFRTGE